MSTMKQVVLSVVGGVALLVVCIGATWLSSHQFLAEGPDTRLAELIGYSWMWAFHLQSKVRPILQADPTGILPLAFVWGLPLVFDSALVFLGIRTVVHRKMKCQSEDVRS